MVTRKTTAQLCQKMNSVPIKISLNGKTLCFVSLIKVMGLWFWTKLITTRKYQMFYLTHQNSNSYKMIQQKNVKPAFSDISVCSITVEFFLWTHTIKFDPLAQILVKFMDNQNFTNRIYY